MARPRYKPVTPDQRIRDLRKEFRSFQRGGDEEAGPELARRLAAFTRAAHDERQLNMAMHTAQLCLEEDPDAPAMLIEAYVDEDLADPEERLRALIDLRDLGRYVEREDVTSYADGHIHSEAEGWVREGDEAAQRHRLRILTSMFDRSFADGIRDRIQFG